MTEPSVLNPHTYVRLTALALWDNLPLVLGGGLLFSVSCAPAFVLFALGFLFPTLLVSLLTVVPGWTALLALEAAILQDKPASLATLVHAWPHYWSRSVRLGLLFSLPLYAGLLTLPLLTRPTVPWIVWLGLAADGLGILVMLTLALYAFPLFVLVELDLRAILRNSLILSSRYLANTLGLLSMGILFGLGVVYLSPALLFIGPALCGMFIVNHGRLVLSEQT